ncbi:unnamed protein product, partial [Discosporangium mesarthrocarpum]
MSQPEDTAFDEQSDFECSVRYQPLRCRELSSGDDSSDAEDAGTGDYDRWNSGDEGRMVHMEQEDGKDWERNGGAGGAGHRSYDDVASMLLRGMDAEYEACLSSEATVAATAAEQEEAPFSGGSNGAACAGL